MLMIAAIFRSVIALTLEERIEVIEQENEDLKTRLSSFETTLSIIMKINEQLLSENDELKTQKEVLETNASDMQTLSEYEQGVEKIQRPLANSIRTRNDKSEVFNRNVLRKEPTISKKQLFQKRKYLSFNPRCVLQRNKFICIRLELTCADSTFGTCIFFT